MKEQEPPFRHIQPKIFLFPEHGKRVFSPEFLAPPPPRLGFSAVEKKKNWGSCADGVPDESEV